MWGLLAKVKFHVNYKGKAILEPLQQVLANSLQYFLRRPSTEEQIKSANYNQSPQSNTCSLMVSIMYPQSNLLPAFVDDSNDEEKEKSELGSLDCIEVKHNIHSSFKRCKKRMSMRDSFAEELVFNILLCLPAQFIHDVMRCVCRQWYAMIRTPHFIYAHLLQSTAGLIAARPVTENRSFFVEMRQGGLEVSKYQLGLQYRVWSSCNGLLLVSDAINRGLLHIVNPITKQQLPLPPFFHRIIYADAGLAFVAGSQEYKVVRWYCSKSVFGPCTEKCVILTIGVDKVWRHINLEHLGCVNEEHKWFSPFVTGEFVHWIHRKNIVSTLNVRTETFMQFPAPQVSDEIHCRYLKMGGNLSFLAECGLLSWEILEMKSETGEWTKLANIDLEDERCKLEKLEVLFCTNECKPYPICWLKPREVLVFRVSRPSNLFIVYDLKTREIQSFQLEERDNAVNYPTGYVVHVNSLVWLEGQ